MIKKLGANLQEAIIKIKGDVQFEYKDLFQQLEQKINTAVQLISEDTNAFGVKWDNELQRFQILMNKKIEDNESQA